MNISVFWNVTQRSEVCNFRSYEGMYCLHLQDGRLLHMTSRPENRLLIIKIYIVFFHYFNLVHFVYRGLFSLVETVHHVAGAATINVCGRDRKQLVWRWAINFRIPKFVTQGRTRLHFYFGNKTTAMEEFLGCFGILLGFICFALLLHTTVLWLVAGHTSRHEWEESNLELPRSNSMFTTVSLRNVWEKFDDAPEISRRHKETNLRFWQWWLWRALSSVMWRQAVW
jgi:hypothetical protein